MALLAWPGVAHHLRVLVRRQLYRMARISQLGLHLDLGVERAIVALLGLRVGPGRLKLQLAGWTCVEFPGVHRATLGLR